jgi:hypothetical protein
VLCWEHEYFDDVLSLLWEVAWEALSLVESYPAETYHIVRARVTLFPPLRPPLAIRDEESPFGSMDVS